MKASRDTRRERARVQVSSGDSSGAASQGWESSCLSVLSLTFLSCRDAGPGMHSRRSCSTAGGGLDGLSECVMMGWKGVKVG